ncbi:acyl-CoA thioesterase [Endozoicomonas sp. SM1973]|uniref:Acyl-CoA thioesterase n=1 Tax=Spartinivicinus marinus TaxID=2994442 RepID=A0A853IHE2_9GAMM|nr:thioesterase family protein [Spartinivicinus marinus]MCX4027751.1 thioesterase family protein [Spartinivicinus marinus]NYZ68555.1 acyl-CoA thioesterase [Spartinivicinus marinus]
MFTQIITPGFYETDALGHINNTVVPMWFEKTREPLFKFFTPDLNPAQWRLILAGFDVQFLAEICYGEPVEIHTGVAKVGNSSFVVTQRAYQRQQRVAQGNTTLVQYDYQAKRSVLIDDNIRTQLLEHVITDE